MNSAKVTILIILSIIFSLSCGSLKGEFAFKSFDDYNYKKKNSGIEFSISNKVKWVYKFTEIKDHHKIGVIIMKKEIVWVEIKTIPDYIDLNKAIIYGNFEQLKPGKYQIVLTDVKENNKVIDKFKFILYSPDGEN